MEIKTVIQLVNEFGYQTSKVQEEQLFVYKSMLIETGKQFNLTAVKDDEIVEKHFYDCALILKTTDFNNKSVIDIGTGAGFPGLVLKILVPTIKITLVEPTQKRANFLIEVVNTLNLDNVTVLAKRAEELDESLREYFDIATSRAVANLRILLELCIPFVKVGGLFIPMKGKAALDELQEAKKALTILEATILESIEENLPSENAVRYNLKIQKNKKTNIKYPRMYAKIKSKPL